MRQEALAAPGPGLRQWTRAGLSPIARAMTEKPDSDASARPLALVTGASAGIGVSFAKAFAARGYDLALVARRLDRLEKVAGELAAAHGVDAFPIQADLSKVDAHVPVMAALAEKGRRVDALVNNAGYSLPKTYTAYAWEEQRDFVMTLVMAVCGMTHAVLPAMLARGGGRIICVGSMAGLSPGGAGHTLYPAAKSFIDKFSRSLDAEVRGRGVKVTCVHPGFTESEFQIANGMNDVFNETPRGMMMSADDVVRQTLEANDMGRVICTPGLVNTLGAAFLKYLPDGLTSAIIRREAEKYRMPD